MSKEAIRKSPFVPLEVHGAKGFRKGFFVFCLLFPSIVLCFLTQIIYFPIFFLFTVFPTYTTYMMLDSRLRAKKKSCDLSKWMKFNDGIDRKSISMSNFHEEYLSGNIDINCDMFELLENRHEWADFVIEWHHIKFLLMNLLPQAFHSVKQDENQITENYDRGNDFYSAFLGPAMVYTSGIVTSLEGHQSLEEMQQNKLNLVCEKVQLKEGEKLLDIGCGWGTLVCHAAKNYGVSATGCTIAREQVKFGLGRAKEYDVEDKVKFLCHDYRKIPKSTDSDGVKYNKITCLEMAEHVGIRLFQDFLLQVYELLADDGLFYLQIAGLRRSWQYEDLIWGMFMYKYIFPGADASCPLNWVINQLEYAGFEVKEVETVGVHYSATLERWYQNWMKPEHKALILKKYGKQSWRLWEYFLAYSAIIARQGSATCYMITMHKNLNKLDRVNLIQRNGVKRLIA